ncbi:MAG: CRISPR-associated endonuclease Cas1 [Candidatus Nitrosocaldaceae archaeon]
MKKIIAITGYGVKIGATGNRFVIKKRNEENKIVADEIEEILLHGGALNITTSAIMLAVKHKIPIFFTTKYGKPYSMINSIISSGTVLSRREQYKAIVDGRGLKLAKAFVYAKIRNQEQLLRMRANDLLKSDKEQSIKVREHANKIGSIIDEIDVNDINRLREVEARGAREYWDGFAMLIPSELGFKTREHRGARDPVNSLLNYGYGVLLSRVINSILLAGLDPYAGFLHVDRAGRPSLALDLIEEFRQPIVDYIVLKVLRLREIKYDKIIEEDRLSKDAIATILKGLKSRFEEKHREYELSYYILEQARNIARFLREGKRYEPFTL